MLLELLNHHQELFLAAIGPLIGARKAADLATLGASCRQLWDFLAAEVPLYGHYQLSKKYLNDIKSINMLCNKYITIRECMGDLRTISYWSCERYINARIGYKTCQEYRIWIPDYSCLHVLMFDSKIIVKQANKCPICINIIGEIPQWLAKYNKRIAITQNDSYHNYTFKIE
jgi:hypothetical protein